MLNTRAFSPLFNVETKAILPNNTSPGEPELSSQILTMKDPAGDPSLLISKVRLFTAALSVIVNGAEIACKDAASSSVVVDPVPCADTETLGGTDRVLFPVNF